MYSLSEIIKTFFLCQKDEKPTIPHGENWKYRHGIETGDDPEFLAIFILFSNVISGFYSVTRIFTVSLSQDGI